jgi:hypothetical protein
MTVLLRRLIYFGYYLRRMDWALLEKFMEHVRVERQWSNTRQWRAIFRDSLNFNISPLEYYQFRFYEQTNAEKSAWAGTGTMYEFQRQANPPTNRDVLRDKRRFHEAYNKFFKHELYSLSHLQTNTRKVERLLEQNERLVLKEATGNCGAGVSFISTAGMTPIKLIEQMHSQGFDLVETFITQHPLLNALSPSAVNTVRVFTQIRRTGELEILGCRLRVSVDSPVDNLAAGNLAAPIDTETGVISGPGVYSDITRPPVSIHPVTGQSIVGLELPYWPETLDLVREASLLHPENRSIGWDIVITEDGPGLIEGNHDWCKLVWQLPVNRGLKHRLYLDS